MGGATAAARLLWAASRPDVDADAVLAVLDEAPDRRRAIGAAISNRVAPLLWRALVATGRTDWAGGGADALRTDHDVRLGQAELLLPHALQAAVSPLGDAGYEPVVFKGPAVAARYPSSGLRPMDDLDVLLPARQHDGALAVLQRAGWRVHERTGTHHDTVLIHPDVPDLPLELHRGLERWRDRTTTLTVDGLWEVREPTALFGADAFTLPPAVELVALAAHAGKPFHHFARLIWSVDLAVVVASAGDALDWDEVRRVAADAGAATVLAVGLHHAARLGATVPPEALELPPGSLRRAALAPVLDEDWPVTQPAHRVIHRLRYALCDGRRRRARLFVGEMADSGLRGVPRRTAQATAWAAAELVTWAWTGDVRGRARGAELP